MPFNILILQTGVQALPMEAGSEGWMSSQVQACIHIGVNCLKEQQEIGRPDLGDHEAKASSWWEGFDLAGGAGLCYEGGS